MVEQLAGVRVFVHAGRAADEQAALDLIADAYHLHEAAWVAVRAEQLGDEFFELRTGRAGAITQKFVAYRMGLAVVGDIEALVAASTSLADWVRESNRGRDLWFVPDLDALTDRLQNR